MPAPSFADFFLQLRETGLKLKVELPFETSRGCWWGQKHHCTFCGLNGASLAFRRKPAAKALAELAALRQHHPGRSIAVVDNILDMAYFRDFLPALAAQPDPPRLFFEVKANLTREQLQTLKAAGVWRIQPGIESLSDEVLRSMRKGLRALQGILLLRHGAELGIEIAWNLLAGFPGENPADYARMARMVPLLTHLQPPDLCSAIRLDRFSPLHTNAEAMGLIDVRAYPAYAHVYDLPPAELDRLAYYFIFRYADGRRVDDYLAPLETAIARWRARRGTLIAAARAGDVLIYDEREAAVATRHRLAGAEAWTLRACEEVSTTQGLHEKARQTLQWSASEVSAALEALQAKLLVISDGQRHLALPLMEDAFP